MGSVEMFYFSRTFSGLAMDHWTVSQSDHMYYIREANGSRNFFNKLYETYQKKVIFFLMAGPLSPPPT